MAPWILHKLSMVIGVCTHTVCKMCALGMIITIATTYWEHIYAKLRALHKLSHWILTTTLPGRPHYFLQFGKDETSDTDCLISPVQVRKWQVAGKSRCQGSKPRSILCNPCAPNPLKLESHEVDSVHHNHQDPEESFQKCKSPAPRKTYWLYRSIFPNENWNPKSLSSVEDS